MCVCLLLCSTHPLSLIDPDFLSSRANLAHGLFTSGCGHYMHISCWTGYVQQYRHISSHTLLLLATPISLLVTCIGFWKPSSRNIDVRISS